MLKIALRNIFRQRRRSLLTSLTMLGGFVLAAVSIAWGDGTYNDVIRLFTHSRLGDIQIHAGDYTDDPSLYKTLKRYEDIGAAVSRLPHVERWAPRVYSGALVSVGQKTSIAQIIGIDPVREEATTGFHDKIVDGDSFSVAGTNEAIIGMGLARLLKAQTGNEVVVVTQAADGSIANDLYTIIGLTESGDEMQDKTDFYLRLQDAQSLLVLDSQVHEIALTVDRMKYVRSTALAIEKALDDPGISVEPWQEFARDFYIAMKADLQGLWIMLAIIVVVVAVGVLNTVLMSVLERRREYGVLLALGTRPEGIFGIVICEMAILALGSIAVGTVIALAVNYALSIHGIALSDPYTYGGVTFDRFRTEINLRSIMIPALTVFFAAVVVAIFPGMKAARTDPARSMRMH
jgi:putative ABC transport system permease protein